MGKNSKKNKKARKRLEAANNTSQQQNNGVVEEKPKDDIPPEADGACALPHRHEGPPKCDTDNQQPPNGGDYKDIIDHKDIKGETTEEDADEQENGEKFYPCAGSSEEDFVLVEGMSRQLLSKSAEALSILGKLVSVCTELHGNKSAGIKEETPTTNAANGELTMAGKDYLKLTERNRVLQEENESLEKKMQQMAEDREEMKKERDGLTSTLRDKENDFEKGAEGNRQQEKMWNSRYKQKDDKLVEVEKQKQDMYNRHQTAVQDLQKEVKNLKAEVASGKRKLVEYEKNDKRQQEDRAKWDQEKEELYECIKRLKHENDGLSTNLSKMMNDKMNEDESQVENVCIKARPLKLGEEFHLFCTNEWLTAKDELDEGTDVCFLMSEDKKYKLLVDILMEASCVSPKHFEDLMKRVKVSLDEPLKKCSEEITSPVEELDGSSVDMKATPNMKMPSELESEVIKYLKIHSDHVKCKEMANTVLGKVLQKIPDTEMNPITKSSESLLNYAVSACILTWKMAIQRPPMHFTVNQDLGEDYHPDRHELQFGSLDPRTPGAKVVCYVYPHLWHGKKLLKKGRVILGQIN